MRKDKEKRVTKKDREYWDVKHPSVQQTYSGRPLPNGGRYEMDVRHFIWSEDIELFYLIAENGLIGNSNDLTATNVQRFIVKILKYVSDNNLGSSEYWLFPAETLAMKQGDCEDGAILMASLLLNALPVDHRWRVRVAAGTVQSSPTAPEGGHAYVTYCRCKDNEWVALDWCYYEDSKIPVSDKPLISTMPHYKDVWFSFNDQSAWSHINFEMKGRINAVKV
jgi:hypothetical protein